METFHLILPAFSMVLGLGVARVLSGLVELFRARAHMKPDWIQITWAGVVFVAQLELWWAIMELAHVNLVWTRASFLLFISLPLLLFVAAALIVPSQSQPEEGAGQHSFSKDGRWGLCALSLYMLLSILADWRFWGASAWSAEGVLNLTLAVLPLCVLGAKSRRVEIIVTVVFVVVSATAALYISPGKYE